MRIRLAMAAVFVFLLACGPVGLALGQDRGVDHLIELVPSDQAQASQVQAPARDTRPEASRVGTAVIRGRVVDGVTGQPLAHVRLRLMAGSSGGAVLETESGGTFEFTELPAGRYYIGVMRRGYMNSTFPESKRTMRSGASGGLTVADGQLLENVTVPLYRGSAITGRLLDANGDPMDNASVEVMQAPSGRPPQTFSGPGVNDIGEFRIGRLQPGTYYLLAKPQGGRWDPNGETSTAPVPTYYPGVLSIDQAQPIVVERGQTVAGMDFPVIEQSVTSITGVVLDGEGLPATSGNVSSELMVGWNGGYSSNGPIKQDGTFELKLAPGEYSLMAYVTPRESKEPGTASRPAGQQQHGMVSVSVGTEPVSNVIINAGDGGTISGRVIFDGDLPPLDPGKIHISALGLYAIGGPRFGTNRRDSGCRSDRMTKVNPDLTFTIEGVTGNCVIMASADQRWHARSAIYRSADLLDRAIEIQNNQSVRDVRVTFTTRKTELSAEVTGDQGEAVQDYVLLAFSAEKARWTISRYTSIGMRVSNPTPVGPLNAPAPTNPGMLAAMRQARQGIISSLPPGDYYVIALDDLSSEDTRDPTFYEPLVDHATRVTLRDGEPQAVQLRRYKLPGASQ